MEMEMESASISMDSVPLQPVRTRNPTENPVHGYPRLAHHMGHTRGSAIFRRFATLNVSVTSYSSDATLRSLQMEDQSREIASC